MDKLSLIKSLKYHKFSKSIINAFSKVPRESFLSKNLKPYAYKDIALPLKKGATISQPYTIAYMLTLLKLKPKQKILEIGSGSGYVLALINEISKKSKIYGIEIIPSLAKKSKNYLKNYKNIKIINKDGYNGLTKFAPFDRILVSASSNLLPIHLSKQLKKNGILIAPVKESIFQIIKKNKDLIFNEHPGFIFVPLINNYSNPNNLFTSI
jgi:protein-L-isoaspartate(D-aspartate) O-methyltransferase